MKYFIILFLFAVAIAGCNDKKQKSSAEQPASVTTADPVKDSAEIRDVISSFYNWYNKNYTKFQDFDLYSGIKKSEAPPYKINWDAVEKYHQFIRDSVPQLGEEFIANQKIFFQQCDSAFKVEKEEEIPYGFDYDWYTNSQEEPQYLVNDINRSDKWIIKVNNADAIVGINAIFLLEERQTEETVIKLAMKKEQGKWKIAKIGIE